MMGNCSLIQWVTMENGMGHSVSWPMMAKGNWLFLSQLLPAICWILWGALVGTSALLVSYRQHNPWPSDALINVLCKKKQVRNEKLTSININYIVHHDCVPIPLALSWTWLFNFSEYSWHSLQILSMTSNSISVSSSRNLSVSSLSLKTDRIASVIPRELIAFKVT